MILFSLLVLFLFLIWLQSLIYRKFWQRNLTVRLKFSVATAREGESVKLTEQITSRKFLPLPWLTVKFQVSRYLVFPDKVHAVITDDYYREDLFSLSMYQRITRSLDISLRKRGYYTIKSIDLLSSDLMLTSKLVGHRQSNSVITVCPRILPQEALEIPFQHVMGEIIARQSLYPDPFEFRSIREYQSYDTMKSINWLATARTGELKVNVNEYTASREVLILLNVEADSAFHEEALIEEGIRIASSMAVYLMQEKVSCSLITNGRDVISGEIIDIPPGQSGQHVQQIQEQLGRLDLTQKPADFADLLQRKTAQMQYQPILLLVSLNCSSRICQVWTDCHTAGKKGIWILPRYKDRNDRLPEITSELFCWEVKRNVG